MEIRKELKVSHSSELCLLMMQLTRCLAVFIGSQEMLSQYQRQYFFSALWCKSDRTALPCRGSGDGRVNAADRKSDYICVYRKGQFNCMEQKKKKESKYIYMYVKKQTKLVLPGELIRSLSRCSSALRTMTLPTSNGRAVTTPVRARWGADVRLTAGREC